MEATSLIVESKDSSQGSSIGTSSLSALEVSWPLQLWFGLKRTKDGAPASISAP